jgi:hypothetical protein
VPPKKKKRSACAFNRGRFREGFHNFIEGATEKEKDQPAHLIGGASGRAFIILSRVPLKKKKDQPAHLIEGASGRAFIILSRVPLTKKKISLRI